MESRLLFVVSALVSAAVAVPIETFYEFGDLAGDARLTLGTDAVSERIDLNTSIAFYDQVYRSAYVSIIITSLFLPSTIGQRNVNVFFNLMHFIPNGQNNFLHLINRRVRQGKRLGLRPQRSISNPLATEHQSIVTPAKH